MATKHFAKVYEAMKLEISHPDLTSIPSKSL